MDTGYGSAEMLGWLVEEHAIAPHIPVWDKSKRTDGTFSREDFVYDPATDSYTCPGNKELRMYRRNFSKPRKPNGGKDGFIRYRASKHDCDACPLKPQCCPGDPGRRVMRSVHEAGRDIARDIRKTHAYMTPFMQRRKVEMLFAHLKRYIGVRIMRLRGPKGAYEQFQLAATAQRLMTMPGIAPVTAVSIAVLAAPPEMFSKGRDFAARVGLAPRQHSTGGRTQLGKISKMGQRDLRRLLIIGAMSVIQAAQRRGAAPEGSWLARMLARKPKVLVAVALANIPLGTCSWHALPVSAWHGWHGP